MRLVVTGTRDGRDDVERYLDRFVARWGRPDIVIVGDARGVDTQAQRWCESRCIRYAVFYAAWRPHGRTGALDMTAGHKRNQRMVELADPGVDWCLAFPGARSRGTWDCIERARARGLRVIVLPHRVA